MDRWLGIADDSLSVGARELCCCVGVDSSFAKAAAKLKKLGQIEVSVERLRDIVEREGMAMLAARKAGCLQPNWRADDCRASRERQRSAGRRRRRDGSGDHGGREGQASRGSQARAAP